MVIDHAFGPPRRARGIVERKAFPFVLRHDPVERRVTGGDEIIVCGVATRCRKPRRGIRDFDQQRGRAIEGCTCRLCQIDELRIDQQHPRFAVVEDVAHRIHIQPRVDGVKHGTAGGHAEMRLCLRGDIGQDRRHNLTRFNPRRHQGRSKL